MVNVLFTVLALFLVNKLGRRKLYFIGLTGMVILLIMLELVFYNQGELGSSVKILSLTGMLLYTAFFAVSPGPPAWLIISETYPTQIRGFVMSITTLSNWLFNSIVVFTFLKLINLFSAAGTFWLYATIGVIGIIWGVTYLKPKVKRLKKLKNIGNNINHPDQCKQNRPN